MARIKLIDEYQELEKVRGTEIAHNLLDENYIISQSAALYPEYDLRGLQGLHRPGVNLATLLFLYDKVIAYVPPMPAHGFIERFGLTYEDFLKLSDPTDTDGQLVYPVLNHPKRYGDPLIRNDLQELLIRMPPTWERWHIALEIKTNKHWFNLSDELFDYKAIWRIEDLRNNWGRKLKTHNESFVSKEIKQQVRNNFTDLCLIGKEEAAREIAELSHSDPVLAINDLLYCSDLYAYPEVMGAGGIANIRSKRPQPQELGEIRRLLSDYNPEITHYDSDVLDSLFLGLKFDSIPEYIRIDFIRKWHQSDQAKKARAAYGELMKLAKRRQASPEDLHRAVHIVLEELTVFCKNAEPEDLMAEVAKKQKNVSLIASAAGLAATVIGIFAWEIYAGLASGALTLVGVKSVFDKDRITRNILKRRAPNTSYALLKDMLDLNEFKKDTIAELTSEEESIEGSIKPSISSSQPVRTIFWPGNH